MRHPAGAGLSRCIVFPNGKPHLMVACGAIIDTDVNVASFLNSVDACDLHFFPAATLRQFGAAGHQ